MARINASTAEKYAVFQRIKPGPRAKIAARLYASGAVGSKKEACRAVGLSDYYLSMLSRPAVSNPEITSILGEVESAIADKSASLSVAIALMARKAAKRLNELVESENEHVALKASADVLDRNPETSKMQRHAIASFNLDAQDAKELAAALVAGAEVRQKYSAVAEGDFVKVDMEVEDARPGRIRRASEEPVGEKDGGEGDQTRGEGEASRLAEAPTEAKPLTLREKLEAARKRAAGA